MNANPFIRLSALRKNRCLAVCALVLLIAYSGQAQNQSHTVVKRYINFRKGQTSVVVKGKADYAQSYVYVLRASSKQMLTVGLVSAGRNVTFSVVEPDGDTIDDAFGVTRWSGRLTSTGEYNIIVVMNNKKLSNILYRLKVTIR